VSSVTTGGIVKCPNNLRVSMAAHGRPALRDLFDESPTPHIAHPHGPTIVISTSQPTGPSETPVAGWVPLSKRATARASHASRPRIRRRTTTSPSIGRCISDLTSRCKSAARRRRRRPHRSRRARQQRQQRHPCDSPSRREIAPSGHRPDRDAVSLARHPGPTQRVRRGPGRPYRQRPEPRPPPSRTRRSNTITSTGEPDRCVLP